MIKKNNIKRDGTTPVYIQYYYSREKRSLINTKKFIDPKYWNDKTKQIKRNHPEYLYLMNYLNSLRIKLERIIDESIQKGKTPTISFVNDEFILRTSPERKQKLSFQDRLDEYVEAKKGQVVNDVVKDYKSLKKHLLGYEKHIKRKMMFSDMTPKFYENFVYYLGHVAEKRNGEIGMQKNTVGKLIKNLKAFLHYCMRNKYTEFIDLTDFKTMTHKTKDIYISETELDQLLSLNLSSHKEYDELRDLFVIGCETGLRFSDLSRLNKDYINGDFINITMKKTLDTVVIPISKRLRTLLDKYNNKPPTHIHSNYFNLHIKKIGAMAGINEVITKFKIIGAIKVEEKKPKHEYISTHTCRRSFCTNQFMKGIPSYLIRKISGHKDERIFNQYVKVDEEIAAKKMLELWNKLNK